ncbi:hypothetical protein [Algihabitans sp.]|uniref:hypothetical protein n=1 Tax=Algihabitans sp. TaxID=2821514 RepID=UPI003BAA6341
MAEGEYDPERAVVANPHGCAISFVGDQKTGFAKIRNRDFDLVVVQSQGDGGLASNAKQLQKLRPRYTLEKRFIVAPGRFGSKLDPSEPLEHRKIQSG